MAAGLGSLPLAVTRARTTLAVLVSLELARAKQSYHQPTRSSHAATTPPCLPPSPVYLSLEFRVASASCTHRSSFPNTTSFVALRPQLLTRRCLRRRVEESCLSATFHMVRRTCSFEWGECRC